MKTRDIALTAVLLVAGTVLQYWLSMLRMPLIPDVITAFSCLAIVRFGPKIQEAVGLGIIAGTLSMLIPGSLFSPGNLVSGPAGAYTCYYFAGLFRDRKALAPLIPTFSATLISGCTFVAIATFFVYDALIARFGNFSGFVLAYLPIIIGTAVLNAVIVKALVILLPERVPAQRTG